MIDIIGNFLYWWGDQANIIGEFLYEENRNLIFWISSAIGLLVYIISGQLKKNWKDERIPSVLILGILFLYWAGFAIFLPLVLIVLFWVIPFILPGTLGYLLIYKLRGIK